MAKRKTIKERNAELKPLGKQLKHYGLVLRAYLNEKQINQACHTFGCSRLIYNMYLNERQLWYKDTKETLSVDKFKKVVLNPIKDVEEYSFLKNVDKFSLEVACENVNDAYDRFFKK